MKKLIALTLILCMACMLVPAMADESIVGTWYLSEISAQGQSFSPATIGMSMSFDLKEDGTAEGVTSYGSESQAATGTWKLEGETISITADNATLSGPFTGESFTLESPDGSMIFTRNAPEAAAPAGGNTVAADGEAAFYGTWTLSCVEIMGQSVPVEMFAAFGLDMKITATIEAGKTTLAMTYNGEGQEKELPSSFRDGKLYLADEDSEIALALTEGGALTLELPIEGNPMNVLLTRAE